MSWLRLGIRLPLFVLFLAGTAVLALTLQLMDGLTGRRTPRTPWARRCFRGACRCLGLQIRQHGVGPDPSALLVANHISWCDIPVLGSQVPVRFLSKVEVGDWPLIGWLAHQAGTLFIRRGGGRANQVVRDIGSVLSAGEAVLVFPEGTTSIGLTVLPFHGRLLSAARDAGRRIQPVSLCYRRDGRPDTLVPFVGDDAFHRHLLTLLKQPPAQVDVLFHEPVTPCPDSRLADQAGQLRETVLAGLRTLQGGAFDQAPQDPVRTAGDPALSRQP